MPSDKKHVMPTRWCKQWVLLIFSYRLIFNLLLFFLITPSSEHKHHVQLYLLIRNGGLCQDIHVYVGSTVRKTPKKEKEKVMVYPDILDHFLLNKCVSLYCNVVYNVNVEVSCDNIFNVGGDFSIKWFLQKILVSKVSKSFESLMMMMPKIYPAIFQ